MTQELEHAKLIPVKGQQDTPDLDKAVTVQFNPVTLKVGLSNTLKAGKRSSSKKSAQFVDKSSSSLTVELVFDTTVEGTDVRLKSKLIAEKFMEPIPAGKKLKAPERCRFQWGAFAFVGMVESFDETVDFFSPEGTPLRCTVSLKLSQDKFQFITDKAAQAARETPKLSSTGADTQPGDGGKRNGNQKTVNQASKEGGKDEKDWRDTALFNGVESPRMPSVPVLAVPQVGASASAQFGAPGFSFGASASLGTNVDGAFALKAGAGSGLEAGGSVAGGVPAAGGASGAARLRLRTK